MTNISADCNVDKIALSSRLVKRNMYYSRMQDEDKWKVLILKELLECKYTSSFIPDFNVNDIDAMISFICTS